MNRNVRIERESEERESEREEYKVDGKGEEGNWELVSEELWLMCLFFFFFFPQVALLG